MKKRYILFALLILIAIVSTVLVYQHKNENPLSAETIKDLFGKDIHCVLKSRYDMGGLDVHGDMYIFYEYDIAKDQILLALNEGLSRYPTYNSGFFKKAKLSDSSFATKWKHMPINGTFDSLMWQGTFEFGEIKKLHISGSEMRYKNLNDPANFYSYIHSIPVGNVFQVLAPNSGKLYLLVKKE